VTVVGMDAAVEHTGMCLLRVTGMTVLNHLSRHRVRAYTSFEVLFVESFL